MMSARAAAVVWTANILSQMSFSPCQTAQILFDEGVCVLDVRTIADVPALRALLVEQVFATAPELNETFWQGVQGDGSALLGPQARRVATGGFGAINYPTAYHAPICREIDRQFSTRIFRPVAAQLVPLLGLQEQVAADTRFEMLPDRVLFRPKGDSPSSESVHRDLSAGLLPADNAFGSFVNLNDCGSQFFSCQPGSHLLHSDGRHTGFTRITCTEQKLDFRSQKRRIEVPPGHLVVFFENILHEVSGRKCTHDSYRKFMGFRLTRATDMLYADNERRMRVQEALIHKGGDVAPMYPKLYICNWPDKLEAAAAKYVPAMCTTRRYGPNSKQAGRTIALPLVTPPSLTSLGKRCRSWTQEDFDQYRPTKI